MKLKYMLNQFKYMLLNDDEAEYDDGTNKKEVDENDMDY